MELTADTARRLLKPPGEDLVYERAFTRMLARLPRSKAQRRELKARRNPDGGHPVPIRWDPTIRAWLNAKLILPTTENIIPNEAAGERLMVGGELLPRGTVGRKG